MGFIENPAEEEAAIRNGWLDADGRVTPAFTQVRELDRTGGDPNRPVDVVLAELVQRKLAERNR